MLDYGDVIVHIFAALEREYYQLDKLWSQAVPIVRIQWPNISLLEKKSFISSSAVVVESEP